MWRPTHVHMSLISASLVVLGVEASIGQDRANYSGRGCFREETTRWCRLLLHSLKGCEPLIFQNASSRSSASRMVSALNGLDTVPSTISFK